MKERKWIKHIFKKIIPLDNKKTKVVQTVTICLQDVETGIYLVSPFTSFISDIYGSKKTTTQVAATDVTVAFLNYIYFTLGKTIDNLEYQDAIDFLNTKDVKEKTKQDYANILVKFYQYLYNHDYKNVLLDGMNPNTLEFIGYDIGTKKSREIIHNIKIEYLPMFLQCAKDVAPDIVLGIFFQFFGGLRCSEVISLEYSNISIHIISNEIKTMYVSLQDKDLRPDLSSAFIAKVKTNRRQEIIPAFGTMLFDLYEEHKKKYKQEDTLAIFIDANGKQMTTKTYARKFNKVKREFIKRLSSSMNISAKSYALYLSNYKWSTHIGRGTFSNLITENSNNLLDIAVWRGDKNLTSVLPYLTDRELIDEKILSVLNKIYEPKNVNNI